MARTVELTDQSHAPGLTKVERYNWTVYNQPGVFMAISKHELRIDRGYQRELTPSKVVRMSREWSHIACGAITVVMRGSEFYVIDGQHRVTAALRRADILELPCIVFEVASIEEEAQAFIMTNEQRQSVSAPDKVHARAAAGDPAAQAFTDLCRRLGLVITKSGNTPGTIKAAGWGYASMAADPDATTTVMELAVQMSREDGISVQAVLLKGLFYIHKYCEVSLADIRLRQRIQQRGARVLIAGAERMQRERGVNGGERVWAEGMMREINRHARSKYALRETSQVGKGA